LTGLSEQKVPVNLGLLPAIGKADKGGSTRDDVSHILVNECTNGASNEARNESVPCLGMSRLVVEADEPALVVLVIVIPRTRGVVGNARVSPLGSPGWRSSAEVSESHEKVNKEGDRVQPGPNGLSYELEAVRGPEDKERGSGFAQEGSQKWVTLWTNLKMRGKGVAKCAVGHVVLKGVPRERRHSVPTQDTFVKEILGILEKLSCSGTNAGKLNMLALHSNDTVVRGPSDLGGLGLIVG